MRRYSVVLWTIGFLACAEVALEIRAWRRGYDTLLFRRIVPAASTPGETTVFGPAPGYPFRSRVVPPRPDSGALRIWLASASYAEDIYLPPDRIFPHRLQELLEQRLGRPVHVLNASRAGLSISDNLAMLDSLGAEWQPEIVLLYQMSSDIPLLSSRYLGATSGSGSTAAFGLPIQWVSRLGESTTAYAILKANVTAPLTGYRLLADSLPAAATESFVGDVLSLVAAARRIGANPVLVTFAISAPDLDSLTAGERNFTLKWDGLLSPEGWVRTVDRFNDALRQVSASNGIPVIDVEDRISGHRELFRDLVHFTPEGHAAVAQELASELIRLNRILALQ